MFVYKWPKAAFVAGDPVLDFLNTMDFGGRTASHDRLGSYSAVLAWSLAAGVIDEMEFQQISSLTEHSSNQAVTEFKSLTTWREVLYRVRQRYQSGSYTIRFGRFYVGSARPLTQAFKTYLKDV